MVRGQRGMLPFHSILFCLERFLVWGLRMWVKCQLVRDSETTQRHLRRFLSQPPERGSPCSVFAAIVRTAGAWAAARLQGGWERARPRQTQEGLLHLLSCRATHPHTQPFSLCPPPSPSALHQLRPAGETAGRCCRGGERRVRVCLCACFKWSRGRSHGWHHCQRDAFKHMHTGACEATLFWTWSLAATLRCFY